MPKMPKNGGMMNSVKGMYSYPKNPMPKPAQVMPEAGPSGNADQQKVNRMLQMQHRKGESLRGEKGC